MARPTLPATLLAHADRLADEPFLEAWSPTRGLVEQRSFAQLADCMLGTAHWLCEDAGVCGHDRVALLAPNTIAYVACSLGAMALGAVSVNCNWRNTVAVNTVLVEGLGVKVMLAASPCHEHAAAVAEDSGTRLELLDNVWPFATLSAAAADELRPNIARLDPLLRTAAVLRTPVQDGRAFARLPEGCHLPKGSASAGTTLISCVRAQTVERFDAAYWCEWLTTPVKLLGALEYAVSHPTACLVLSEPVEALSDPAWMPQPSP